MSPPSLRNYFVCLNKLKNKKPCCPRSHRQRSKKSLKGASWAFHQQFPLIKLGVGGSCSGCRLWGSEPGEVSLPVLCPAAHGAPWAGCAWPLQAPVGGAQGQRLISRFPAGCRAGHLPQASGPQPRDDLFTGASYGVSRLGKGQRLGGMKGLGREDSCPSEAAPRGPRAAAVEQGGPHQGCLSTSRPAELTPLPCPLHPQDHPTLPLSCVASPLAVWPVP